LQQAIKGVDHATSHQHEFNCDSHRQRLSIGFQELSC